jgi:hypothetical protein
MAPAKKTTDVTIDQITNNDFLNNCCPMRTGSRCRNKSACALKISRINDSNLQHAENFLDQIKHQITSLKPLNPTAADPAWDRIQANVVEVLEAALCRKHMADFDIAMEQTMFFLKHSCGISRVAQNGQSHEVVATINYPPAPETSQLPPTSTYAPVASHLVSPPASPPNSGFQESQQVFLGHHFNGPVKTESVESFYSAQPQQVPAHPNVHTPTSVAPIVAPRFATPITPEATKEQPPPGFNVRPRENRRAARSTRLQATSGLGGHGRTEKQEASLQTAQHQTSEQESISATELRNHSLAAHDSGLSVGNEVLANENSTLMNENEKLKSSKKRLNTKCRNADARIDELEKENISLKQQRDSAVLRGGELRLENVSFKSEIREFKATIEQLEEENDGLQSELETSEEKVEQLEQELAELKKHFKVRS